jgi:hypothetical protein
MENNTVSKYTISFGLSLALCCVINGLLVVAKEKSHAVSGWLQSATGYQWVTHVVIIVLLFGLFGFLLARTHGGQKPGITVHRLIKTIVAGVVAGGLIIIGFYLISG